MSAGELEFRAGMIKPRCRFPSGEGVAPATIGIELAAMFIGVATQTLPGQAKIGPPQIFDDDFAPFHCCNVFRLVASSAFQAALLTLE